MFHNQDENFKSYFNSVKVKLTYLVPKKSYGLELIEYVSRLHCLFKLKRRYWIKNIIYFFKSKSILYI